MNQYRPEVDGLRAIAVVPVVLYHAGTPSISGGYVGVDVFFVISGYLITSILLREMQQNRFSVLSFYERRVRRLLPALFAVLVFTTIAAFSLLPPIPFRDYSQSLAATTVFASNFLFFLESGYFDAAAESKPLLHTWSLAVEEQFYLLYPLLLVLLTRYVSRYLFLITLLLVLVSFCASLVVVEINQPAAFYLLPFRAWELGLGALLAMTPRQLTSSSRGGELLRWSGITAILASVFSFSSDTLFPGLAALLPCLGAVFIVGAGATPQGLSYRLLSSRPAVFIGQISYSLYLWHWPIIVFMKLSAPDGELNATKGFLAVLTSVLAATISWKFIESPFRTKSLLADRRILFSATVFVSLLWIGAGVAGHLTNGLPQRLSPEVVAFAAAAEDFNPVPPRCDPIPNSKFFCIIGDHEAVPSFVFWGDSHAGILSNGVHAAAVRQRRAGIYSGVGGCPPFFAVAKDESSSDAASDAACTHRNAELRQMLADGWFPIELVILASRWSYYAEGGGVGVDSHNRVSIWREEDDQPQDGVDSQLFGDLFVDTMNELADLGLRVIVMQQVPEFPEYSSARVVRTIIGGDPVDGSRPPLVVSMADLETRQRAFAEVVGNRPLPESVSIFGTHMLFCGQTACSVLVEGRPTYFDNNHVTTSTALKIGELIDPIFGQPDHAAN